MTDKEILARVDHTLLKADAKKRDIERICKEALEYHTASICINPCYIEYAVGILGDKIPVCTVIGFPLGAMTTEAKVFEAKDAVEKGAKEVDMVINIGKAKDGDFAYVGALFKLWVFLDFKCGAVQVGGDYIKGLYIFRNFKGYNRRIVP